MFKILIVDDDKSNRKLISGTLKEFQLFEAESGQQALDMLSEVKPDLVLLDQRMPQMDGLATLEAIHKNNPHIICIMITAEGTLRLAVEAMKRGAFDFIVKPFDPFLLIHTVKKAVNFIELIKKNRSLENQWQEALQELVQYKERMEKIDITEENKKENINILLVEDNEGDVQIMMQAFKEARFKNNIHVSYDGQEALDFIYGKDQYSNRIKFPLPDLIISDINMPRVDGLEFLKKLKENPEYQSIPVIMFTSSRAQEDIIKSYSYGASNYISKPMNYDDYLAVVEGINFYWAFLSKLPERK